MKPNEKIFKLPRYEIKDLSKKHWKKVSEKEFLKKLADSFILITPLLSKMFQGKEIITRDCIFRIRDM